MITPSFGLTATERVLPKLALDFTTATLDSRITFARTLNTATRINSVGNIEVVNADVARFDYDPITLTCRGLLIEESRQNVLTQSGDFSNAAWNPSNVTVGAAITAPDNTTSAVKIIESAVNNFHQVAGGASYTSGTRYTFSFFAKAAERTKLAVFDGTWAGVNIAYFDLSTGVATAVSTTGSPSASMQAFPGGWYRCVVSTTPTSTTGLSLGFTRIRIVEGTGTTTVYLGDGTSGVYLWGGQLEVGAFATSYIPTTTTALTRNADVASMTGTNFSSWFNASEGGAVIQVLPRTISGTRPAVEFDDNTANETIVLRGVAADPQLYVVDGGAAQATLDAGTITANAAYRLAGAWKSSSFATAINGAASVSQLSGTYPTVTQARFGSDGTNYLNGWLQNFRYWPQRITNAETQAFSK